MTNDSKILVSHHCYRCMLLDLASLESVRSFVDEVKHHHDSVQTLVCNAGVWIPDDKKSKSVDGFEVSDSQSKHFNIL